MPCGMCHMCTKYMLFSYNKTVNFLDISVGKINETSVTMFLGIHHDKNLNFVNHIIEMSMKVAVNWTFI